MFNCVFCFCFFKGTQNGSFKVILDRPRTRTHGLNFSQRRSSVKPLNAEPKRNDSIVPLAASIVAPGECERVSEFQNIACFFIVVFFNALNDFV